MEELRLARRDVVVRVRYESGARSRSAGKSISRQLVADNIKNAPTKNPSSELYFEIRMKSYGRSPDDSASQNIVSEVPERGE